MSLKPNAKANNSTAKPVRSNPKSVALTSVRQFQSDVAAIREAADPRSAKLVVHILASLLAAALVAAFIVRLDRIVSSISGKIVTTQPATVLMALDPSIIKTLDVKEGNRVAKGQLLATLDPTFATATVNQLKAQIDSAKTQIARDQAEVTGSKLEFAPNDDPDYGKYEKVQKELFDQQMAQYKAQLQSFDQKIALTEVTISKFKVDEGRYKDEGNVAKQVEDMWTTLQTSGNGSLLNLLIATNAKLETLRQMEFDRNSVVENEHALASLRADRATFMQQFLSTTNQDLVTQRNNLDAAVAQLDAAMKHQEIVRLVAPDASVVLSIAKLSVGSVLKQGDTLMTLTPIGGPIEAEVEVSTQNVGFVRPGDSVDLKFDAFDSAEHGTGKGKVRWISEDAFTVDDNGNPLPANTLPYFKVGITITEVNLNDVPTTFRLVPGMTLTADIKVGTRSLAMYLLGGVVRTGNSEMREP